MLFGFVASPSTIHDPSSGLAGAEWNTSRIDRSAPRMVRVSFRTVKKRLCWSSVRYDVANASAASPHDINVVLGMPTKRLRPLLT